MNFESNIVFLQEGIRLAPLSREEDSDVQPSSPKEDRRNLPRQDVREDKVRESSLPLTEDKVICISEDQ